MNRPGACVRGSAAALLALAALGCGRGGGEGGGGGAGGGDGGRADPAATAELKQIGLAYHNYYDERKKGPPDADALRPFLAGGEGAYQGLKDGRYRFVWNADLLQNLPSHEVILAYHKDVPSQGGPVLFLDASTKNLTAEQFKAARMAKAKS
jgi:hypothetical protein